jgi:hypothetical protein
MLISATLAGQAWIAPWSDSRFGLATALVTLVLYYDARIARKGLTEYCRRIRPDGGGTCAKVNGGASDWVVVQTISAANGRRARGP